MDSIPKHVVDSVFWQSSQIQPTAVPTQEKDTQSHFGPPGSVIMPSHLFSTPADFSSTAALTHSILASTSTSQYTPMLPIISQDQVKHSLSISRASDASRLSLEVTTDLKKDGAMDTDDDGSPVGYAGGEGSPDPCGDGYSKKRHRLRPEQTRRLLEIFEKTTKPDSEMRKVLGRQLDMTPRTVQIWFQNRRAKIKREGVAAGAMLNAGLMPPGQMQGRNRLTLNRNFMNRRQVGRVASDGYEHLQGMPGFDSHSHSALHGLPLQSPCQVSIPMDVPPHPQFSMQHVPGAQSHGFGNSAIGIPISEHTTYHRSAPVSAHPGQHMGGMEDVLGNVLPMDLHGGQQFPHSSHAYHAGPPYMFAPAHTMPMHSGPMNHQTLGVGSHQGQHRMRAFTADSSTLAQMPRMTDPFDDSMTDYASGFESVLDLSPHALQPRYSQGDLLPTHGQSPRALPTDFSTEQLRLLSRMRRLEDIKTIANTNAMRSKQAMELSTGIVPATAEPISPTAYHAPTGPNGAPAMPAELLPVKKAATTSALMGTSSDMMLQPQLYHASSDIASMHKLANSVGHSHHSSSDISGQDRSGAPLGPGVPSADASLLLGADIGSFNLAQTQLLGDIMSQCGPMNFFQNIGNQEQDLHSAGLPLDAASSNSGLGELGEQLFAPGPLSPKLAALAQPESTAANESQASAVDKPLEEQLIPSSLFSNGIGVLKKRERPPYSSGAAEKACFAPTVSSTPPLGNGEPDPNATLASFLFNTNSPPLFQPDVTPYAPNVANQGQAPIAVQGPIKHWPNGASVVSVAASGHAGQRDLTIEQLHPYTSI